MFFPTQLGLTVFTYNIKFSVFTYNIEVDEKAHFWFRAHLALVYSGIFEL
jgi:hypothetical protein